MKAVIALQKQIFNQSIKVSTLLLHAYAIASKLSLEKFKQEFRYEIEGFNMLNNNNVPIYRYIFGTLHVLNTSTGKIRPLNTNVNFEGMYIKEGIIAIEEAHFSENNTIRIKCGDEIADFFKSKGTVSPNDCFLLVVGKVRYLSILQSIRMKILEFALVLEEQGVYGEEWIFDTEEKSMAINITNFQGVLGDVNGGTVNQNNKLEVKLNDFESLAMQLQKYGLEVAQIEELKTIIEDNPSSPLIDGYSDRFKKWLGSLGGSVSTELVVEAIKIFSGF